MYLSVHNNAIMQTSEGIKIGSIIDIDTSLEKELPDFFNTRKKLLKDCHNTEKELFSSLLSEEYVQTFKNMLINEDGDIELLIIPSNKSKSYNKTFYKEDGLNFSKVVSTFNEMR